MLDKKTAPLTRREAKHLLCRAAFSASPRAIELAVGRTAEDVVRDWIAEPTNSSFLQDPPWIAIHYPPSGSPSEVVNAFRDQDAYYVQEVRAAWMREILDGGLRTRMALLWHNHFVTDVRKYRYAALAFRYVRLMQSFAFGNYRSFVKAVTTEGSMLYYLDGRYNTRAAPNENYARELMELFTMGPVDVDGTPNYTQTDITEAARALTGWRMDVRSSWSAFHSRSQFDAGPKTFLGRSGEFDSEDIVDVIFDERPTQVARFLCRALVSELVHHAPEEEIVEELAQQFIESGFDIGELLVTLLSSSYFFEERFMGVRIKDPLEMMALQFSLPDESPSLSLAGNVLSFTDGLGQSLLAPPNVAGWPGHHAWLNTDLLPRRWSATDWTAGFAMTRAQWEKMARDIGGQSPYPAVEFAIGLAEQFLAVPLEFVSIPEVAEPFGGNLVSAPLPDELLNGPAYRVNLVKLFLSGIPWYEWNPASEAGIVLITNYVRLLSRLPEFQLS